MWIATSVRLLGRCGVVCMRGMQEAQLTAAVAVHAEDSLGVEGLTMSRIYKKSRNLCQFLGIQWAILALMV